MITFPFVQIASGLRYLSLSSAVGNIVAIALYVVFCLIPMLFFVWRWVKHKLSYIDALLPITTILMFIAMYQLINPALLNNVVTKKLLTCITIYSVICTYLILKLIQLFQGKKLEKLCKYLTLLLWVVNILLTYYIVFTGTITFTQSIKELQSANSGNIGELGPTYLFLFLGMIVEIIPLIATIAVVLFVIRFVKHFAINRYSEQTVISTNKLSCVCKISLVATALSTMVFNLLQYAFGSRLYQINSNINIPVFSIVFVLVVLVFSQIISEGKELKDDNDSII